MRYKKLILILISVIIIVAIGVIAYVRKDKKPSYEFIVVERSTIIQKVSVTGRVKPRREVNLAFQEHGKVEHVYKNVGDKVRQGDILTVLNDEELDSQYKEAGAIVKSREAELAQYKAALTGDEARLKELHRGAKKEDIQVSETRVVNAKKALEDANISLKNAEIIADTEKKNAEISKKSVENKLALVKEKAAIDLKNIYDDVPGSITDAYSAGDDAVNKYTIDLFNKLGSNQYVLTFNTSNTQAKSEAETARSGMDQALLTWKNEKSAISINSSQVELDQAIAKGKAHLAFVQDFLDKTYSALNFAISSSTVSNTTLNTYRTNVSTARTNINTSSTNLNAQEQSIAAQKAVNKNTIDAAEIDFREAENNLAIVIEKGKNSVTAGEIQVRSAENALTLAGDELRLKKSGATPEEIEAQEARVKQSKAVVLTGQAHIEQALAARKSIETRLDKIKIKAPFSGIITKQEAKAGETVLQNTIIVSLVSDGVYEIETFIPEIDIANVKVGESALITLDAYGADVIFKASVFAIDPAETISEGVATYKTTLVFEDSDERIRSGMTVNIEIETFRREGAIAIPARAVISKDGAKIVRRLNDKDVIEEVPVVIGIRDSLGQIEIVEGISGGDRVIVFMKER